MHFELGDEMQLGERSERKKVFEKMGRRLHGANNMCLSNFICLWPSGGDGLVAPLGGHGPKHDAACRL